jgi:hypothetical protein
MLMMMMMMGTPMSIAFDNLQGEVDHVLNIISDRISSTETGWRIGVVTVSWE